MKTTIWLIVICLSMSLYACASQDPSHRWRPTLDRPSLIVSMTYTQRQLLDILLNPLANGLNEKDPILLQHRARLVERRALFLSSHCDLIRRKIVNASVDYPACHGVTRGNGFCIIDFHQCIAKCANHKRDCPPCEQQAIQCLSNNDDS
mgnify:FL=1